MPAIQVRLAGRSYDVLVEAGALEARLEAFVRDRLPSGAAALLSDANVDPLYGEAAFRGLSSAGLSVRRLRIEAGEASKSPAVVARLWEEMLSAGLDRGSSLVALGGGVVGDVGGFASATYMRGLPFLMIPTSLLAQVDSSVGGKTGVNHAGAKNLVGVFAQPAGVLIDPSTLGTLPRREFVSGLAEAVKEAVILDAAFFDRLEAEADAILALEPEALERMIRRSVEIKASVVEADEREVTGKRALLNLGHTVGHALESSSGPGVWRHGEAVAAGMVAEARLAERFRGFPPAETARLSALLETLGLPVGLPADADPGTLLKAMGADKKALSGRLRFVLPERIGRAVLVDDVRPDAVLEVLRALRASPGA